MGSMARADIDAADEIRRRMRDLVSMTALPALWIGRDPQSIIESVAQTLLTMVDADLAHARADSGEPPVWSETLRATPAILSSIHEPELRDLINSLLTGSPPPHDGAAKITIQDKVFTTIIVPFGYKHTSGHILLASERPTFPNSSEHMLCQVAANQVAVALREADLVHRLQGTLSTLQTVTEHAAVCFFLINQDGRCTYMNPTAEQVFGYTPREMIGQVFHDKVHHTRHDGSHFPMSECPLVGAIASREPVRAHEDIMYRKGGTPFPVLCAATPILNQNGPDEVVIEVHDITKWKRAEHELLGKMEKDGLLSKIGLAIRVSHDPDEIEAKAAELLGSAVHADRCFFARIDLDRDYMRFGDDWHRDDLPSLVGEYQPSAFGVDIPSLFVAGKNLVIEDALAEGWPDETIGMLNSLQLRALVDIPFFRGNKLEAILCVGMRDRREWTRDEISLIEAVAAQTRTAIDSAAVIQREHRIATTLQEALLPPLPPCLPGLELSRHYQAALDESNVGGDFYAAYPLDKSRHALIIGDVSGKGLAAASQVALLQNMLHFALCTYDTVATAVTQLNSIVSSQNLLTGFATMFVGVYDPVQQTLTYASCGHEPPLLLSNGTITALETTGPPIGVTEDLPYGELTEELIKGDILLLYTDGLSEAGPDRRALLGTDGLTASLYRHGSQTDEVSTIASRIVADVMNFGNGQLRDDACLIVARRTEERVIQRSAEPIASKWL